MTADPALSDTAEPGPAEPEAAEAASGEDAVDSEQPWRRLSIRVFRLGLLRMALSLATGIAGVMIRDDTVWPLIIGAAGGLLGALSDLSRWRTTRFRITPQRVEMRTGWIARKHRLVARDRIRSVDSSARLLPRLLGLRTVHIGSGETETSFRLDALDRRTAELVQQELSPGGSAGDKTAGDKTAGDESTGDESTGDTSPDAGPPEVVITRLRRNWVPLNALTPGSLFAVAAPLLGLYWALRAFDVDLLAFGRDLTGWDSRGIVVNVVLVLLVAYPLGFVAKAVSFVVENWNFALVRTGMAPRTALVTRRGLFTTTTVQRSDERTRGIAFVEPLFTRWLRATRTKLLLTGSGGGGEAGSGDILPTIRMAEARELAAEILTDGARPLEEPLRRHPRGALVRRIGWAVYHPVLLSGALLLFVVSGALPGWVWPLPLLLIPVTVPLAIVGYRALGHTVAGDYLVVRGGALSRRTVALQRRAVIGWSVEQSLLQRWAGRMNVGVATAAGSRHYEAPDMSEAQAMALIAEATPHLAAGFIEPDAVGELRVS